MLKISQNDQETTKCIYYSIYSDGSSTHLAYSFSRIFLTFPKLFWCLVNEILILGRQFWNRLCVCVYDICFFADTVTICLSTWLSFFLHYNIFNLLITDLIFTFSSFSLSNFTTFFFLHSHNYHFYLIISLSDYSSFYSCLLFFHFSSSFLPVFLFYIYDFFFGEKLILLFTLSLSQIL